MVIVVIISICLLLYGVAEYRSHRKNVDKIPLRILVNGTRGKTTLTRIIAYSLQESGIKTVARTSGSSLEMIHADGSVEKIERKRRANILEMIPFFRSSVEEGAEAVVVECMALQAENQKTIADTLVRPNVVVITNTFIDHVPEMGESIEETSWVLSNSVPRKATLYTSEDYYQGYGTKTIKVEEDPLTPEGSIPIHPSSWAIAKRVLTDLGVKEETIISAIKIIPPDIGLLKEIKGKNNSILIPSFSVNDKECMARTIRDEMENHPRMKVVVVFNNRKDREHRIKLLKEAIYDIGGEGRIKVLVIGDYKRKVSFYLKRRNIDALPSSVESIAERMEKDSDTLFIGVGNIKGEGERLIDICMEENQCYIPQLH